jgi:hypothetical protein
MCKQCILYTNHKHNIDFAIVFDILLVDKWTGRYIDMKKNYSTPEFDIRLYADVRNLVLTASYPENPDKGGNNGGLTDGDDYDIFK